LLRGRRNDIEKLLFLVGGIELMDFGTDYLEMLGEMEIGVLENTDTTQL
jgi:hypothetical protein